MSGNYTNGTVKTNTIDDSAWIPYDHAAAVLSFVLGTTIIFLNSFVIYTLVFRERKKSRLFFFILHLAIADLLVGVICCLADGIESALHGAWYSGDVPCRLWRYSKFVLTVASNNLLIGMSVDRFIAVKFPLNFVRGGICSILDKCLVIGAWIIGLTTPLYFIQYFKGVNGIPSAGGGCSIQVGNPESHKIFVTVAAAVVVLLPLAVILFCYMGITIVIWRTWQQNQHLSEMNKTQTKALHVKRQSSTGLLPKAKIKTIKMTFVICLAFLCCWLPYFVCTLLDVHSYQWPDPKMYMVFGYVYPLNSACNPVIVILFNSKLFFKKGRNGQNSETLTTNVTAS